MSPEKQGSQPRKPGTTENQTNNYSTKSDKKILPLEGKIKDENNPFTEKGFKICIINHLNNIDAKIDALQRQAVNLKKDILRIETQIHKKGYS